MKVGGEEEEVKEGTHVHTSQEACGQKTEEPTASGGTGGGMKDDDYWSVPLFP